MRRYWLYMLLSVLVMLLSCSDDKGKSVGEASVDTIPVMVTQIQKCSKLYTSEFRIHKIITHSDKKTINGSFLKQDFSIDIPIGERRIAIPMTATLKAYIDMSAINSDHIRRDGKKITVTLPDPQFVLTSTKINNEDIKQNVPLLRGNFSDDELADYAQQGRTSIVQAIPKMGITENARKSAARTIVPIIREMGYSEEDITVVFRKEFTQKDIESLLVNSTERYGKDN